MKTKHPARRLLQLVYEIEPEHVQRSRARLPGWIASGAANCPYCDRRAPALTFVSLTADAKFEALCDVHPDMSGPAPDRALGVVGTPAQLAVHGARLSRAARAHVDEHRRAHAGDGAWFDRYPDRRFRARPPRTPWERSWRGPALPGGFVYALIERGAPPHARAWVSMVVLPFDLSAPPLDMPAAVVDAIIQKIIEDELGARRDEVLAFDGQDLERDQAALRGAQHAVELALTAAAHRKDGEQ